MTKNEGIKAQKTQEIPKESPNDVKDKKSCVGVKPEAKQESPPVASKPSTSNNKKNAKPVQKGSISTFFNKPTTGTKNATEEVKQELKNEKSLKVEEDIKMDVDSSPRKRSVSTVKSENEKKKPLPKKLKLKEPANKKRSRIQVIDDSSEEEEEEQNDLDEPGSKLIKFDREETPEPKGSRLRSPTPEKEPEKPVGKHKAKRWVTKRFETEDGFIKTERVLEEYSASEDEAVNDENRKKNSPQAAKEVSVKKTPERKSTVVKAKTNGNVKTKQGSIMNFFTKK